MSKRVLFGIAWVLACAITATVLWAQSVLVEPNVRVRAIPKNVATHVRAPVIDITIGDTARFYGESRDAQGNMIAGRYYLFSVTDTLGQPDTTFFSVVSENDTSLLLRSKVAGVSQVKALFLGIR